MNIDIHSSVIDWLCSSELYNSLNEVVNRIAEIDGTVKKVQMYEDFLLPNDNYRFGKYPFMDDNRIYYPLTLIHRKNIWDIQWISWSRSNIRVQCPFSLVEEEKLEICKEVPSEFIDAIEGKELVYFRKTKYANPEFPIQQRRSIGRYNQSFIDEVARQISEELMALSGCVLSPKWGIVMEEMHLTYEINKRKYRVFKLSTSIAECISIGVCWEGEYDVCDYIKKDSVKFQLTEYKFHEWVSSFEKIKHFIANKGFVYTE